jgi:hypothetical protein
MPGATIAIMERDFMRNIEGGGDVPNSAANSLPSSAAGPKVPLPAGSGALPNSLIYHLI